MTSEMEESHIGHFLKISGEISNLKKKEFEQTIRFVFNQMPPECLEKNLTVDVNNENRYYFFTLWTDEKAKVKFMGTNEYQLIKGAYSALSF
jgi:quinol monooxygenase YgiN